MVPSGLTSHPEKILSGERIERQPVVTTVWYVYPIETGVLTKYEAGNWKLEAEDLKVYITGMVQWCIEHATIRHQGKCRISGIESNRVVCVVIKIGQ